MKKNMNKILSLVLCVAMIAAMAIMTTGCGKKPAAETTAAAGTTAAATTVAAEDNTIAQEDTTAAPAETAAQATVVGEGATSFTFVVTDAEGNVTNFEVKTDKKTVGEALVDSKLVEGEVGEYGLMVNTVNGITLDWDKDQMYWAFFIDGEYASTGVDSTDIVAGSVYSMTATKG